MSGRRVQGWVYLPLLLCAVLLVPFAGFVPDDLYIYLQFARNAVERGEISFNPGEPVNAVTSPLWFLMIAGARAAGLNPLVAAKAASALAALLAVAGVVVLVRRTTARDDLALLGGLLMAVDPWLLRWGASGMEGAASAAAVVWTFALRAGAGTGGGRAAAAALLLALTPLLRPECALLVLVLLVWGLLGALRGGGLRQPALDAGAVALLSGSWGLYALITFGSPIPATAVAKGTLGSAFLMASASLGRVAAVLASGQATALMLLALGLGAAPLLLRERGKGRPDHALWWPAAIWVAALAALYALRHVSVYTRYLLTATPLLAAAGPAAAGWVMERRPSWRGPLFALAGLGAAVSLAFTLLFVLPRTWSYAEHMESVNRALARDLAASTRPDAVIAVPNIGAIGYISQRRILDLNGLVNPDLVPYKRQGRLDAYLREHPPDFFIDIHQDAEHALKEPPGLRLDLLESLPFRHMFLRQPKPLWYSLYRVEGPLPEPAPGEEGP